MSSSARSSPQPQQPQANWPFHQPITTLQNSIPLFKSHKNNQNKSNNIYKSNNTEDASAGRPTNNKK
jgi:hypothetical protein